MQEIEAIITGKVQMVLFRDFVQRKAFSLGLSGTVENRDGGSVRVVAQGTQEKLEKLVELLHKGPFLARVAKVAVEWRKPTQQLSGFIIVY